MLKFVQRTELGQLEMIYVIQIRTMIPKSLPEPELQGHDLATTIGCQNPPRKCDSQYRLGYAYSCKKTRIMPIVAIYAYSDNQDKNTVISSDVTDH